VCASSLLYDVLCTRIGVLVPGFTVFLVDYSLDYVLYSVHCLLDFALCEFIVVSFDGIILTIYYNQITNFYTNEMNTNIYRYKYKCMWNNETYTKCEQASRTALNFSFTLQNYLYVSRVGVGARRFEMFFQL